jgi:AcrR family transcriptional regulator
LFQQLTHNHDRKECRIIGTAKKKTEIRKQQIIDAARMLIFKSGSEHLTVKNIASEVGITDGAIYKHFKSKKMILSFLLDYIRNALLADISLGKLGAGPATIEMIEKSIETQFSDLDQRKGISFQVIAEIISLGDKDLNKQAEQTILLYISALKALLAKGVQDGAVRPDIDTEAAATLLFGLIQGAVSLWTLSNGDFKLKQKFADLWRIYRESIVRR